MVLGGKKTRALKKGGSRGNVAGFAQILQLTLMRPKIHLNLGPGERKRKQSLFVVSWEEDADCRATFLPEVAVE